MLLEARRHAQALDAQRRLAEDAEASRLSELRAEVQQEFADVRKTIEESANGLAATIAEMEDRLAKRP
jgi:TRAP-type mannitol/chloroaromatic compound transport system substrate-binding protein